MPSYVPGCRHDVFVSYAHVDDEPLLGASKGWVSSLVENLETLLAQKLGRREAYSLWMDHDLARADELTPAILEALKESATLLTVLSPGYVASPWCRREARTYIRERHGTGLKVFVVEYEPLPEERPVEFRDRKGFRFWVDKDHRRVKLGWPEPDSSDHMYYERVLDLGDELATELRKLRSGPSAETETEEPRVERSRVFLAEVTDDIDDLREEVRRFLEQAGVEVVPQAVYARDPVEFRAQLDADLARSALFVQLLSRAPGKRPPDLPQGYVGLQHERAERLGCPVLQWRPRDLEIEGVRDEAHRKQLAGDDVQASSIEELKQEILRQLSPEPEPRSGEPFVLLDAEEADREVADRIGSLLHGRGIESMLGAVLGQTELISTFGECTALVLVHGRAPAAWVRQRLRFFRKHAPEQPLSVLAIVTSPAEAREEIGYSPPASLARRIVTVDCSAGVEEACLGELLELIGQPAAR